MHSLKKMKYPHNSFVVDQKQTNKCFFFFSRCRRRICSVFLVYPTVVPFITGGINGKSIPVKLENKIIWRKKDPRFVMVNWVDLNYLNYGQFVTNTRCS